MLKWLKIGTGCVVIAPGFAVWHTAPLANPGGISEAADPDRYAPRQVLRQPIRPITNPVIVAAAETDTAANELVIGVEVNGAARAYPINQLTGPQREIINDVLGGTAIAATW